MVIKEVLPYGTWPSPITADIVTSATRSLSSPRVSTRSGRAFCTESTTDGRRIIFEVKEDGVKTVLPAPYSVSSKVYEYGGSLYDVVSDGRIIFSNIDNTVRLLNPDTQEVSLLIKAPVLRYSSFSADANSPWVLAIEEDHTVDTAYQVRNYIVAINTLTAEVKRVVTGADFYYSPLFSPDGEKVAWLQWNHPDLPFDAAKLFVARWRPDGSVSNAGLISGSNREGVAEPRWGFDGKLFFAQETGNYRQLYSLSPGSDKAVLLELKGLEEAEIGEIGLMEGSRTYAVLSPRHLVASAITNGFAKLIAIDLKTNAWVEIAEPEEFCMIKFDSMVRLNDTSVLAVSSGVATAQALYTFDIQGSRFSKTIRKSMDESFPASLLSKPRLISIKAKRPPTRDIYGFLWMPKSSSFTGPEDELPPLIISTHGGPTGYAGCGVSSRIQYFTSRGYAYLMLNYTGSTAHGKSYRNALFGYWGILDVDDSAEFADFLVSDSKVRAGSVGLTGLSAGGYNTLMGMARYPSAFAGGVAVSSISDVKRWDATTHKLESDYGPALVFPPGTEEKDKDALYRERSALFLADRVKSPLLIIHGKADSVVNPEQATLMADALAEAGADFKLLQVEGEGHTMAKPSSAKLWLEEEEKWWRRTLL